MAYLLRLIYNPLDLLLSSIDYYEFLFCCPSCTTISGFVLPNIYAQILQSLMVFLNVCLIWEAKIHGSALSLPTLCCHLTLGVLFPLVFHLFNVVYLKNIPIKNVGNGDSLKFVV